jgi:hypothetical protein
MMNDGRERALANLSPDAALRHGIRAADGALMLCRRCCLREQCPEACEGECPAEARYLGERRESILGLPHIDAVIDGPAVALLVWCELRLLRWARYLAASGETLPGAPAYLEAQPADKHVTAMLNTWTRLLEKLSLTPATRRALEGRGEAGPGAALASAIRELSRTEAERKPPVHADFEATDEGVPM